MNLNKHHNITKVGKYHFQTYAGSWHCVSTHLRRGGWEIEQQKEFLKHCSPKKYSIDIGGQIGAHAVPLADFSKKLIVFEPNKDNFRMLEENISLNKLEEKSLLVNKACGDVSGVLSLGGKSLNSLYKQNSKMANNFYSVEIIVLDDFLNKNIISSKEISFIKIDVEGFELQVLKGMKETLSKSKDLVLYLETHRKCSADESLNPKEESENFLRLLGFSEKIRVDNNSCFWSKSI